MRAGLVDGAVDEAAVGGAGIDEAGVDELVAVVYSSTATLPFSELDLAALLLHSRENNAARGLTGVLLHRDGQFMQLLEGPRGTVRATLATIAADPRHTGVWTLDEERITARRFGSWAMGYRQQTRDDRVPAAWFGSGAAAAGTGSATRSSELLDWFRAH